MSRCAHFMPWVNFARKAAGRDRASLPAADIGHVGEIGFQLFRVLFGQRQLPGTVIGPHAGRNQFGYEVHHHCP